MTKEKYQEHVFKRHKKYKGCIKYAKLIIEGKHFKIEKRRPFGWESYTITKEEYDSITNNKIAATIWAWHHFGICGDIKHPLYGKTQFELYKQQLHKDKS